MDIWAEGKDPFNEYCKRSMTLALKIKGERFNDFDYQQEVYINVNIANS